MSDVERLPEQPIDPEKIAQKEQVEVVPETPTSSTPVSQTDDQQSAQTTDDVSSKQSQDDLDSNQETINIPANNEEELKKMSKGNVSESKTWFGVYWIRRIKKSLLNKVNLVFRKT